MPRISLLLQIFVHPRLEEKHFWRSPHGQPAQLWRCEEALSRLSHLTLAPDTASNFNRDYRPSAYVVAHPGDPRRLRRLDGYS